MGSLAGTVVGVPAPIAAAAASAATAAAVGVAGSFVSAVALATNLELSPAFGVGIAAFAAIAQATVAWTASSDAGTARVVGAAFAGAVVATGVQLAAMTELVWRRRVLAREAQLSAVPTGAAVSSPGGKA